MSDPDKTPLDYERREYSPPGPRVLPAVLLCLPGVFMWLLLALTGMRIPLPKIADVLFWPLLVAAVVTAVFSFLKYINPPWSEYPAHVVICLLLNGAGLLVTAVLVLAYILS
jgi:hypothetical protein